MRSIFSYPKNYSYFMHTLKIPALAIVDLNPLNSNAP